MMPQRGRDYKHERATQQEAFPSANPRTLSEEKKS